MKPIEIYNLFKEYVEYLQLDPILHHDFVGKDGDSAYRKRSRLLTMQRFRLFAKDKGIKIRPLEKKDEFEEVFDDIKDFIYCENVEGAAAGIYSASIVQRIHGLVEKQEVQQKNIDVKMDLGQKLNANNVPTTKPNQLPN